MLSSTSAHGLQVSPGRFPELEVDPSQPRRQLRTPALPRASGTLAYDARPGGWRGGCGRGSQPKKGRRAREEGRREGLSGKKRKIKRKRKKKKEKESEDKPEIKDVGSDEQEEEKKDGDKKMIKEKYINREELNKQTQSGPEILMIAPTRSTGNSTRA